MIASGISPASILDLWLGSGAIPRFRLRPSWPGVPALLDHGPLLSTIQAVAARPLTTPLAVVATKCRGLRPVIFRSPRLDWRHLAASCAIPFVFPPASIDGALYCDGGVWTALPLFAAYELGATEVVAIHCIPRVGWPVRPLLLGFRRLRPLPSEPPPGVKLAVVAPERPLANAMLGLSRDPRRLREWAERGREDARHLAELYPSE